jgi:putative ABC transport system permease protein
MKELNFGCAFQLQPIVDIHLKSDYGNEAEINGNEKEIYILSIIGIFVLLIGWINYINLSTAKSMERAKEVGMRKVVGAARLQLMLQFIVESFILNFIALCIAALIVICLFPFFGSFIGKDLRHGFGSGLWQAPWFWIASLAIFAAGSFIVGSYPAFVLSAFKPVLVLKGKFTQSGKGISLRRALVSFQFILSILLIAGTITVYKQLSFMRNQKLDMKRTNCLLLKRRQCTIQLLIKR